MNMNIGALLTLKKSWDAFRKNHPKFPAFLDDISARGIPEGTVLEMRVKYEDGTKIKMNISVKEEDVALLKTLQDLR